MHFFKSLIISFVLILFVTKANSSIYIVDNYAFTTSVKKIKNSRKKVIEEIKKKSLNDFLKSITTNSDHSNIKKINNYQEFIQVFIVKNEYKQNDGYKIISKIQFDQVKINTFLKDKNVKYINFKSNPILLIILKKQDNKLEIWPIDNLDWNKESYNLLNVFLLNGDLTDIKLISEIDPKTYQLARFDNLTANYGVRDFIFVLFDYDIAGKKENVFVRSQFNELKSSTRFSINSFDNLEVDKFYEKLVKDLNNTWKEIQILSPQKKNLITIEYKLKDLKDYTEIKKKFSKNNKIILIKDLEITKSKYIAQIQFSGLLEDLRESMSNQNYIVQSRSGKIYLSKND